MLKKSWPVLLFLALLLPHAPSRAGTIAGVTFADTAVVGEGALPLRGLGLMVYKLVFNGYVAALYLPADVAAGAVLADVPKRLELHYFWDIKADKFGPAAQPILARNLDAATLRALQPRIDQMQALYVDIAEGDRFALTYVPGQGTTLSHNGRDLGTVAGADFAAAYFGIWLGEKPLSPGLKQGLLGGGR